MTIVRKTITTSSTKFSRITFNAAPLLRLKFPERLKQELGHFTRLRNRVILALELVFLFAKRDEDSEQISASEEVPILRFWSIDSRIPTSVGLIAGH